MNGALAQLWTDIKTVLNYPFTTVGGNPLTLRDVVQVVFIPAVVLVAERYLRRLLRQRVLARTHLEASLQYAISRFVGYCFILLGFFVALKTINLDLSSLAVLAGAVGIGVGFGLQNIISNFVSGIIILAERPIAIGHRIEVGDVAGQVVRISLRSTTVVTNDNITIIVPNSNFISNAVTNWSHGDPKVRLRLPVGVAYGTDVEKLRRTLVAVAEANPHVLKEPPPAVRFLGFGDSSLDFELAVWTIEMAFHPTRFRSDLYFAIERALRENQIEVPFPQRDLHLRSGKIALEMKPGGAADLRVPAD
jgi:small-conductance mechanosensitive channel